MLDPNFHYLDHILAAAYKDRIEQAGFEPAAVTLRPYGCECKIGIALNFGRTRWLTTVADAAAFLEEVRS